MRHALCAVILALWSGAAFTADASLTEKQAQAKKEQAQLRERIESLQKKIDSHEATRRDAANELKESESAISIINRRIVDLGREQAATEDDLKKTNANIEEQKRVLAQRQKELGDQLRAQYASGLSPWTALLSGDDPRLIGRDLSYLGYITEAQSDAVSAVRTVVDELAALQVRAQAGQKALQKLAQETAEQKESLLLQHAERQKVLARIEGLLKEQRGQAEHLARNDQRLGGLISGLEAAIEEQARQARIAEEQRRAAAARKAEQERLALLKRRQELEQARQEARKAEQQALAAQAQAKRERDELEAEKARLQVEQARAQARAAEQAEQRQNVIDSKKVERLQGSVEGTGPQTAAAAPTGDFAGLRKGLPYPVKGDVLGRFGAERPEGGLWRGIVLLAPEGTPVRAAAAGRVVYANWLSGFGNLMILDHGEKYLTVYAYTQSLLKRVGNVVAAGETIATVGATGGQVESGLYFEIRHQGTPVNPLLWLRQ